MGSPNMNIHTHSSSPSSAQSLQMKLISHKDTTNSAVNKRLHFYMMVWLCAYYDFYDKKVYLLTLVL